MSLIRNYLDYVKDNPKGYWFKNKPFGYGWTPAKPAGWLTMGVYILIVVAAIGYGEWSGEIKTSPEVFILFFLGATALLLGICWKNGEPLHWQWGFDRKEDY